MYATSYKIAINVEDAPKKSLEDVKNDVKDNYAFNVQNNVKSLISSKFIVVIKITFLLHFRCIIIDNNNMSWEFFIVFDLFLFLKYKCRNSHSLFEILDERSTCLEISISNRASIFTWIPRYYRLKIIDKLNSVSVLSAIFVQDFSYLTF